MLQLVSQALDDGKAQNLVELDVRGMTAVTDYMLICSGTSNRHVKSLAQNLVKTCKDAGHQPNGVEGMDEGEWVLVDLGGVVAHVMQQQTRAFYQLEKLWSVESSTDEPTTDADDHNEAH
ncbi:MAG: ribosome silencing factor [Oceanococcus sp.]